MTFVFRNPEAVTSTGFNGWLNTATGEVVFCGRCAHMDLIKWSGQTGFDGEPLDTGLSGIHGDKVFDLESEGGPRGSGWTEIRQWCAEQDWIHFVTRDDEDMVEFTCAKLEQEKVCREFARSANATAFFKSRGYYGQSTADQR